MGGGSVMLDFGPGLIRHEATMGMTVPNGLMILSVNLGLVSRLHQVYSLLQIVICLPFLLLQCLTVSHLYKHQPAVQV
jgi:hypothetical protein